MRATSTFSAMQTPVGPSLRIAALLAEATADLSGLAVRAVWDRWLGPQRHLRKLAQLEKAGLLERSPSEAGLERVVRLTEAGRNAAAGGRDPDACWRRRWDGRWRLVIFDVQETKRTQRQLLQRQLKRRCFGYLQDSVWITPDPVDDLRSAISSLAADAAALTFLEARPCSGESDADLVRGAWDFARINRAYDDYLEVLRGLSGPVAERAAKNWLHVEWRAWLRAVNIDPLLPEALLPRGYRGRDAWKRRREKLPQLLKV